MKVAIALLLLVASTNAFNIQSKSPILGSRDHLKIYQRLKVEENPASATEALGFVNDGLFSFVAPFLEIGGIKSGKKITYGFFATEVDRQMTWEEKREQERTASQNLVNIGDKERARREKVGNVILILSLMYSLWAALIADDGGLYGHFLRFLVFPTFALGYGYKLSAQTGL